MIAPKVINSYGTLDGPANLGPVQPTKPAATTPPTQPAVTPSTPTYVPPVSQVSQAVASDLSTSLVQTPKPKPNKQRKPGRRHRKHHVAHRRHRRAKYYEVTSQVHWDSYGRMDPKRGYGIYEHRIMRLTHYAKGHPYSMHFATLRGKPRGWVKRIHCKPVYGMSLKQMHAWNKKHAFTKHHKPFKDKNPILNGRNNVHGDSLDANYHKSRPKVHRKAVAHRAKTAGADLPHAVNAPTNGTAGEAVKGLSL